MADDSHQPGPPSISEVARMVAGASVSVDPPKPLNWAWAHDDDGNPLYLVAVVMGRENVAEFDRALRKLQPHMKRVDTFDDTEGKPADRN